jgi:hypothetical protein
MLKFAMPLYEAKCHEGDEWIEISELKLMDQLYKTYTKVMVRYRYPELSNHDSIVGNAFCGLHNDIYAKFYPRTNPII